MDMTTRMGTHEFLPNATAVGFQTPPLRSSFRHHRGRPDLKRDFLLSHKTQLYERGDEVSNNASSRHSTVACQQNTYLFWRS